MKSMLFGLFLSVPLALSAFSSAEAERGERRQDRLFEELELSEEQKASIESLRAAHREKIQKERTEMRSLRKRLRSERKLLREMMQGSSEESQLKAKFKEIQKLHSGAHEKRARLAELRFENGLKIRELLTPEQRKDFRGWMKERRRHRGERHGRMRGSYGRDRSQDSDD